MDRVTLAHAFFSLHPRIRHLRTYRFLPQFSISRLAGQTRRYDPQTRHLKTENLPGPVPSPLACHKYDRILTACTRTIMPGPGLVSRVPRASTSDVQYSAPDRCARKRTGNITVPNVKSQLLLTREVSLLTYEIHHMG